MLKNNLTMIALLCTLSLCLMGQSVEDLESPVTSLTFEQSEFHFGSIMEGEIIQNVVTFTNTGDEPLVISNAKATCGCTVPQWPREPIMPGESGEFLVQFDSKNKGSLKGSQVSKRVTITANTDPVNSYFTIKGKVFKPEEGSESPDRHDSFDIDASTIKIWPNPTAEFVHLNLGEYAGNSAQVDVYSIMGERVTSMTLEDVSNEVVKMDVSGFESGTYTFSISLEGHNRIAKTVIVQ